MTARAYEFLEAMERLQAGDVIWCRPRGYRGFWIAFSGHHVYKYFHGWERCKNGVSTILSADWYDLNPGCYSEQPPERDAMPYESESFLASERNRAELERVEHEREVERLILKRFNMQDEQITEITKRLSEIETYSTKTVGSLLAQLGGDFEARLRKIEAYIEDMPGIGEKRE